MKKNDRRLTELCGFVRDEAVSADELAELEAILAADAEARQFYLRFMQIDSLLEKYPPIPDEEKVRTLPTARVAAWLAAAAAIVLGAVLFWPQPNRETVATLVFSAECIWASRDISEGERLPAGSVSLESGTALIRFDGGAEAVLSGAVELVLQSAGTAELIAGEAVFRAEDGAEGFVLKTPSSRLVDLGTEFAVNVGPGGSTELHVHEGEVSVDERIVSAGHALRIDSENSDIAVDAPRFQEVVSRANPRERRDLMTVYEGFHVAAGTYEPSQLVSGKGWAGPWRLRQPSELIHGNDDSDPSMTIATSKMDVAWPIKGGQLGMLEMPAGNTVRIRTMKESIQMDEDGIRYFSFLVTEPDAVAGKTAEGKRERLDVRLTFRSSADYGGEALSFGWERSQFPRIGVDNGPTFRSTRRVPDGQTVFCVGKIISRAKGEDEIFFRLYTARDELDIAEPAEWDVISRNLEQNAGYDLVLITSVSTKPRYIDEIRIGPTWRSVTPIGNRKASGLSLIP